MGAPSGRCRVVRGSLFVASLLAFGNVAATVSIAEDSIQLTRAEQLLSDGKFAEAATAFETLLKAEPANGLAWYELASARYQLGDHGGAIEAGEKAASHSRYRGGALYNIACSQIRLGNLDDAARSIDDAIEAGFVDFDLIGSDPDLAALRSAGRVKMPPSQRYERLHARNGVELPYRVVLPANYQAGHTYPAFVAFAPGGWGPASMDWAIANVWGDAPSRSGWIAVYLVAPDEGWMTHPAHHAMEELLANIQDDHSIEAGRFHLVGIAEGSRPASNYAGLLHLFQSTTLVANHAWHRWDDNEIKSYKQDHVFLLVGESDTYGLQANQHAAQLMNQGDGHATLEVFAGEGTIPVSLKSGGLLAYLDANVRR